MAASEYLTVNPDLIHSAVIIQRSNRLNPGLEADLNPGSEAGSEAGLKRDWFECRKQASKSVMRRDAIGELEVLL